MISEKRSISQARAKSFVLVYLQEHGIIYTLCGIPRWTKSGTRASPGNDVIALWKLETEGYVEKIEPELPIWAKYPHRTRNTTHRKHTGYVYKITEIGKAKKLRKNLEQTDEYRNWLDEHLKDDENYHRFLAKVEQRANELQALPYQEYLKTEEWKVIRAIVIERAKYICQHCGNEDEYTLQVHHRKYGRRGYENLDDLIALCSKCHALHHGKPLPD